MSVLTGEVVAEKLKALPHWKLEGKEIVRRYEFAAFHLAWNRPSIPASVLS